MANWLNQLQSLLGQSSSSTSSSADQGLGKLLVPGALGGLAGLLVANKSARKLLTKYGTKALLVGRDNSHSTISAAPKYQVVVSSSSTSATSRQRCSGWR